MFSEVSNWFTKYELWEQIKRIMSNNITKIAQSDLIEMFKIICCLKSVD